jgi:hypothetical protein
MPHHNSVRSNKPGFALLTLILLAGVGSAFGADSGSGGGQNAPDTQQTPPQGRSPLAADGPDMTNVDDILGGQRTLLEIEDVVAIGARANDSGPSLAYSFYIPTKSGAAANPKYTQADYTTGATGNQRDAFATGSGWMFNTRGQQLVSFSLGGSGDLWKLHVSTFLATGNPVDVTFPPDSGNRPVPLSEQIAVGPFQENGLDSAMLVYAETAPNGAWVWKARLITALDPSKPFNQPSPQNYVIGPAFTIANTAGQLTDSPVIAKGNFEGQGKADLAVYRSDIGKISILTVTTDSQTNIPIVSQKASISTPEVPGCNVWAHDGASGYNCPFALAAGRFRDSSHDDLAFIAQAYTSLNPKPVPGPIGLTAYAIAMQLDASGNLTGTIAAGTFIDAGQSQQHDKTVKVIALTAPLKDWTSQIDQLLIINDTSTGYGGHLYAGTFDPGTLAFTLESDSQLTDHHAGCVYSASVGNLNATDPHGNPINAYNLTTYWASNMTDCSIEYSQAHAEIRLWPFNVSEAQSGRTADWLSQGHSFAQETELFHGLMQATILTGDLEGRSIHLGPPMKVTIYKHSQPDLVLGLPPMHADWIDTIGQLTNQTGCGTGDPCLANLTVIPTKTAPGVGFQSAFSFTSTADDQTTRESTMSFTAGVKQKFDSRTKTSLFDVAEATAEVRESLSYAFKYSATTKYNTYNAVSDTLTVQTSLADFLLYTDERENIYYYPVIGEMACPATAPNCPENEKQPLLLAFSAPDTIYHTANDATQVEWYQPVQEPGNIFSYPWTLGQLEDQYHAAPLTNSSPPVQGIGSFKDNYQTQWTSTSKKSSSVGMTHSLEEGLGFTLSGGADLSEVFSQKFTFSVDLSASQNFGSLKTTNQSVSASTGVSVNNPGFDSHVKDCCSYNFSTYALGMTPYSKPFDTRTQPADISATGPLFLAFNADINNGNPWWKQAYVFPDIGFNHPARWSWDPGANKVSFNYRANNEPNPENDPDYKPEDDPFYQMKGFFITEESSLASGTLTGPTINQANAGDKVLLTTRVYNFSPVSTPENATIYVSIWGQKFDGTNLVGDSKWIGYNIVSGVIPGYQVSDLPNWTLVTIPFDTTAYSGEQLVFWALVFMTDLTGAVLPEMPGHGLNGNPSSINYQKITDVPTETYSNNVGLYGTYSPFFVKPRTQLNSTGSPNRIAINSVTLPGGKLFPGQRAKVSVQLPAGGASDDSIQLLYFDGDPARGGVSFAQQDVTQTGQGNVYNARAFYTPQTCGLHDIYVVASLRAAVFTFGPVKADVSCGAPPGASGTDSVVSQGRRSR